MGRAILSPHRGGAARQCERRRPPTDAPSR